MSFFLLYLFIISSFLHKFAKDLIEHSNILSIGYLWGGGGIYLIYNTLRHYITILKNKK